MELTKYALKRILLVIPQMVLISVATFVLIRMLPGDPARLQLGPMASDEGVAALREKLRLDESIPSQYMAYLERLFQGDLGRSWVSSTNVSEDLLERIPATLELIAFGMLLVALFLVPLGIVTAVRGGGPITRFLKKISFGYGLLAGALPDFWLGLLFIFIFFTTLGVLPGPEGRLAIGETPPDQVTGFYTIDSLLAGDISLFFSSLEHLFLPALTLAFVYGAVIFKMTRSSMEAALRSNYISYSEGFGLSHRKILWYAFRNAAPPVVVMVGVVTGFLLGGAVLIETVFNLSGVGQYAVQSITSADYAPIQAFVLLAAVFTMLAYLIVDLVYFAVDPRVRAKGTKS